jgi:histidine triad (HIT) family protein
MNNCPFCEENSSINPILLETNLTKVIFSNPRLVMGHLLIVPKRHVTKPWDLTPAERNDIFNLIYKLQKWLSETMGDGCDLRENYRPFLPQDELKVDHIHYHLIPRRDNDNIYYIGEVHERNLFTELPDNEAEKIKKLFSHAKTE